MAEAGAPPPQSDRIRAILRVAWLAIALGIGVQLLVFAVRLGAGQHLATAAVLADLTQGIAWAFVVCIGVAVGVTAARERALMGGVLGAISGPLGWGVAKSAQRVAQNLLGTPVDQFTPFFFLLVVVKGVEYLLLGWAVGRLSGRADASARDYALPGAAIGAMSAAVVIGLNLWQGPLPLAKLLGLAVSEFTFPIGCALVIYAPMHIRRFAGLTTDTE